MSPPALFHPYFLAPPPFRSALLLAAGDVAVLLVFALAGRANHGGAVNAETLGTALPFIIGGEGRGRIRRALGGCRRAARCRNGAAMGEGTGRPQFSPGGSRHGLVVRVRGWWGKARSGRGRQGYGVQGCRARQHTGPGRPTVCCCATAIKGGVVPACPYPVYVRALPCLRAKGLQHITLSPEPHGCCTMTPLRSPGRPSGRPVHSAD